MSAEPNHLQHGDATTTAHVECHCEFAYRSGFQLNAKFKATEEITAIIGPSGSGKTTLLSLIAGLLRPMSGFVQLNGKRVTDVENDIFLPPHRRHIGFLFQQLHLFPHQTVESNLKYGWRRRSLASSENRESIDFEHVVKTLEIDDLLSRTIGSLSRGQQQRIALGRAILSRPRILLLDEPFTAVEEALRGQIAELIDQVVQAFQIPTILVSHNEQLVARLTNNSITLANGCMS